MKAADWADNLILVVLLAWIGALVGTLLAHSLFDGRLASLIAAVYGLFLLGWQFGLRMDPALLPRERIIVVLERLRDFLRLVARGEDNPDSLIVVLFIAGLYWIIGNWGAWALFRRRDIWQAVVPAGVALLLNRFYYFGQARLDLMLALYILVTILFLLHNELSNRQEVWRRMRAQVDANVLGHVARTAILVALLLVSLSWVGPAFARSEAAANIWFSLSGPWRRARDRIANAMASMRSNVWFVRDLSDTLALEQGVLPPDELVLEVEPETLLEGRGRFYWRARTYDFYQGGRWYDLQGQVLDFNPAAGTPETSPGRGRKRVEFTVRVHQVLDRQLYVPAQPEWVNMEAQVKVLNWDEDRVDISAFLIDQPLFAGGTYRARGSIATPTDDQLRAAPTDYPEWIEEPYLQVPEEISDRTRALASQITSEARSPFDRVATVTAWLRQNIEYQRVSDAPPADREPLDWFLFEYRAGFCNYYASAQVILLRTLGIPARLATGYAQGRFDTERGVYLVNARDYHAWPEVYFPGYGWVEFEPTVTQAPISRAARDVDLSRGIGEGSLSEGEAITELDLMRELRLEYFRQINDQSSALTDGTSQSTTSIQFGRVTLLLLGLALVSIVVWTRLDVGWRMTMAGLADWAVRAIGPDNAPAGFRDLARHSSPAHRAYQRWLSWWPRLGLVAARDQTPMERASLFADSYPSLGDAGWVIARAYAAERFGGRLTDRRSLAGTWRQLAHGLRRVWLGRSWRRLLERLPLLHPSGA